MVNSFWMVVGIDVGGTNTDAAIVGEEISTVKLPNELGLGDVLKKLSEIADLGNEKLIVSTSLPLNLILSKYYEIPTFVLLVPGSGLNYSSHGRILRGFVNHRGDVVEDLGVEEVKKALKEGKSADNLAIAAKFSVRNPELEHQIFNIAKKYFDERTIALSHHIGEVNFPLRVNTTVVNAKIRKTVYELTDLIKKFVGNFFFYKGDGGVIPYQVALRNPSVLFNSSPAAVAVGAYYLAREKNALVIDIGGTTTDFVVLEDGKPRIVDKLEIAGMKTLIRCVDSVSLPFGGDSAVENFSLRPVRLGKPIAFGGEHFTLTDALNCIGFDIGNAKASREAGREIFGDPRDAEGIVEKYVSMIADSVKEMEAEKIVGTGFLAKYLVPMIAKACGVNYVVPEHSEAANAVGVAVSRVSLTLYARFDTETGRVVYNGELEKCELAQCKPGHIPSDEELIEIAMEKARELAISYGASPEDVEDVRLIYFNSYTVVRDGLKKGKIADVVVQIEPGISSDVVW